MAQYKIFEIREIVKAFQVTTLIVKADTLEEAIDKIENRYDDDTDVEEYETEYDVRDTEFLRYDFEKLD